jgi:hypothetical protein
MTSLLLTGYALGSPGRRPRDGDASGAALARSSPHLLGSRQRLVGELAGAVPIVGIASLLIPCGQIAERPSARRGDGRISASTSVEQAILLGPR